MQICIKALMEVQARQKAFAEKITDMLEGQLVKQNRHVKWPIPRMRGDYPNEEAKLCTDLF